MKVSLILFFSVIVTTFLSASDKDSWVYELKPSDFDKTKKLAEKGNLDAQHKLGVMYVRGVGTEKDGKTGYDWYRKAATKGHVESQYILGLSASSDRSEESKVALEWLYKACDQKHVEAMGYLGASYMRGSIVDRDYKKAVYWLKEAVRYGGLDYYVLLGQIYRWGDGVSDGVPEDLGLSFDYYKKAALAGNYMGQFAVGDMLAKGVGVPADFVKAYAWTSVAKANGHLVAAENLDSLVMQMSKEQIAIGQVLAGELFEEIANGVVESPVHTKFD